MLSSGAEVASYRRSPAALGSYVVRHTGQTRRRCPLPPPMTIDRWTWSCSQHGYGRPRRHYLCLNLDCLLPSRQA
jgi:hypothetical protein